MGYSVSSSNSWESMEPLERLYATFARMKFVVRDVVQPFELSHVVSIWQLSAPAVVLGQLIISMVWD